MPVLGTSRHKGCEHADVLIVCDHPFRWRAEQRRLISQDEGDIGPAVSLAKRVDHQLNAVLIAGRHRLGRCYAGLPGQCRGRGERDYQTYHPPTHVQLTPGVHGYGERQASTRPSLRAVGSTSRQSESSLRMDGSTTPATNAANAQDR